MIDKSSYKDSHTNTKLMCPTGWNTKYRYHIILKAGINHHCRELIFQICDVEEVKILKGVVSKDYIHSHIELSSTDLVSVHNENQQ